MTEQGLLSRQFRRLVRHAKWGLPALFFVLLHPLRVEGISFVEVLKYLDSDRKNGFSSEANLFIGSSSILLWDTLATDMAPMEVIQRGFSGATLAGIAQALESMVYPYAPDRIVLFAGANDVVVEPALSAGEIFQSYRQIADGVAQHLPETCLIYIAITPTPARMAAWPEAVRVNQLVANYASQQDNLLYLNTDQEFLDDSARPLGQLFVKDGIHLSPRGYAIWTRLLNQMMHQCP